MTIHGYLAAVVSCFLMAAGMSAAQADDDNDDNIFPGADDDLVENAVYNSIPFPFPGSAFSQAYAAKQVDEFGDHVSLAGSNRSLSTVFVALTSFTCENDPPGAPTNSGEPLEPCLTTPGSSYTHLITLNLYEVVSGGDPAVGTLITSKTVIATVPFRPSWDSVNCTAVGQTPDTNVPFGGRWFDPVLGFCVTGFNFVVPFDFDDAGITLPDELIYGIEFNTNGIRSLLRSQIDQSPGPWSWRVVSSGASRRLCDALRLGRRAGSAGELSNCLRRLFPPVSQTLSEIARPSRYALPGKITDVITERATPS